MIGIADSILRTGALFLIVGLLAGCARLGMPVATDLTEVRASDEKNEATDESELNDPQGRSSQQRRKEAVAAFEAKRNQLQYDAAMARWHAGDAIGCQQILVEHLARRPQHREARLLLTDLYMITDQQDRALENARIAARQFADDPEVLHAVGLTFEMLKRNGEALGYFRRSFELDDQSEIIRLSYQNAVESASESQSLRPEPPGEVVVDATGLKTTTEGQQAVEAIFDAERAGDSQRAEHLSAEFLERYQGQPEIFAQAGKSLLQCNQPERAMHLLESAVSRQTESADLHRILAMVYYRTGDYEASHRALQFSLSLDKSSALSYFLLGATLSKLGMSESAERSYRRATEIDPRYSAWQ